METTPCGEFFVDQVMQLFGWMRQDSNYHPQYPDEIEYYDLNEMDSVTSVTHEIQGTTSSDFSSQETPEVRLTEEQARRKAIVDQIINVFLTNVTTHGWSNLW